jgi:endonuclease IV
VREYHDEEVAAYREAFEASKVVKACLFHAVYLINCASEDREIRKKSLNSLTDRVALGRRPGRPRSRPARRLGPARGGREGDRPRRSTEPRR